MDEFVVNYWNFEITMGSSYFYTVASKPILQCSFILTYKSLLREN